MVKNSNHKGHKEFTKREKEYFPVYDIAVTIPLPPLGRFFFVTSVVKFEPQKKNMSLRTLFLRFLTIITREKPPICPIYPVLP